MPPSRSPRPSTADRIRQGRAEARALLDATPAVSGQVTIYEGPMPDRGDPPTGRVLATLAVLQPWRADRWKLPAYLKLLELPPLEIERTLGGLFVHVNGPGKLVSHRVLAHPAGQQSVERRNGGMTFVPVPASAHCVVCKSTECPAAHYALALLPHYMPESPGFQERYASA